MQSELSVNCRPPSAASAGSRFWWVMIFAAAMAWMESATVFYLRSLVGRIDPYQAHPLPMAARLAACELIRELATMVLLTAAGWLAGRRWWGRFGFFAAAFGAWDIGYYVILKWLCGWPKTWLDWDVLFLIPLPWWGPVVAPMGIGMLMIAGGGLLGLADLEGRPVWPGRRAVLWGAGGVLLGLYVFMEEAILMAATGPRTFEQLLPQHFNWPGYGVAWVLMAVPVWDLARQWRRPAATRESPPGQAPAAPQLLRQVRWWLAVFIGGLLVSGATALPLNWEMDWLLRLAGTTMGGAAGGFGQPLADWLQRVHAALAGLQSRHAFIFYGTDWLAFGHFMIALVFVGAWRNPVRNAWLFDFGLLACALVIPYAAGFGHLRGIPWWWRMIDCSFGVGGAIPLWFARRAALRLAAVSEPTAGAAIPPTGSAQ